DFFILGVILRRSKIHLIAIVCIILLVIFISSTITIYTNINDRYEPNVRSNGPLITTQIIRPNSDNSNSGWDSDPIFSKIDDSITYPTSGGDGDFVEGDHNLDDCLINMDTVSLTSNQKVIALRIYARGRKENVPESLTISVSFSWKIGDSGSLSISKSLQFDDVNFHWLYTTNWNDLELTQSDLNDLIVRMRIVGTNPVEQNQKVSVMYVELTVETNRDPTVDLLFPSGGEHLENQILVEWNYTDLDDDTVYFNLSYQIEELGWEPIISDLINETNYLWNLVNFTSSNYNVTIRIQAEDGNGGYDEDISDYFIINQNDPPTINLLSPNGGETIRSEKIITWTYNDPDGDPVFFNISYNIGGLEWFPIVSGLVNQTSYLWNLKDFNQTYSNVTIRIEAYDGKSEVVIEYSDNFFTIKPVVQNQFEDILLLVLILGSTVASSGVIISVLFFRNKRKRKRKSQDNKSPWIIKDSERKIDLIRNPKENNHKKLIIEADILIRKRNGLDQKDLLSKLFSESHLIEELEDKEGYEVVKVLGKINITTLSDEFWNKIEQFNWEENEKEEFVKDMLGLPPKCREQFIDQMLEKFKKGGEV
ncbi:MAG: hypothetical protein ACFE9Z_10315, partial [Promethearchaeota archaeon]